MATRKFRKFESGGSTDKEEGLKASKGENVGFFERLRMGNIDEEGSEAYNRFGAGRGKAERAKSVPVEDRVATPVIRESAKQEPAKTDDSGDFYEAGSGVVNDTKPDGPKQRVNAPSEKPAAPSKASPKMQEQTYTRKGGATADERAAYKEEQFKLADAQARSPEGVARRKKMEQDQAIERVTPETALLPGGGLKALNEAAKKLAAPKLAKYAQEALPAPARRAAQEALPSPTKRLGYDKAGSLARKRSERASARQDEMLKENARRYGLDEDAPGYAAAADAVRKGLGGKDFGLKKGGSVKRNTPVKKMAFGGAAKSESKPVVKGWGMARGARPAKMR